MYVIAAVLAVLWLLCLACGYAMDGAVHLFLFGAITLVAAKRMWDHKRNHRSEQQAARSRQLRRDLAAPKTWHLK
jgi:hypothetical protein